jgi:hypothetical protein
MIIEPSATLKSGVTIDQTGLSNIIFTNTRRRAFAR